MYSNTTSVTMMVVVYALSNLNYYIRKEFIRFVTLCKQIIKLKFFEIYVLVEVFYVVFESFKSCVNLFPWVSMEQYKNGANLFWWNLMNLLWYFSQYLFANSPAHIYLYNNEMWLKCFSALQCYFFDIQIVCAVSWVEWLSSPSLINGPFGLF